MKLNEVFPSNYIKSEDLQGRDVPVTISQATMEKLGDDTKLVLHFQGKTKGMVCNKTNANRIAYLYGDDTDAWEGKEIVLTSEFVEFQGRTVKGLRVKPPSNPQPQQNGNFRKNEHADFDTLETVAPTAQRRAGGVGNNAQDPDTPF
jgi:F0F1-type ATP synthase alpha subunit